MYEHRQAGGRLMAPFDDTRDTPDSMLDPTVEGAAGDVVAVSDRGSALILTMVMMVICSLVIVPTMSYGSAVLAQSRMVAAKVARVEATKGGVRVALATPERLYAICDDPTAGVALGGANDLALPSQQKVSTRCYKIGETTAIDSGRYAVATIGAGSAVPAGSTHAYPSSGSAEIDLWVASMSDTQSVNAVWNPLLPSRFPPRSSVPYEMPSEFGGCRVFFPGTYTEPITIDGAAPVFFASGVYSFAQPVTVSGSADVVVGQGVSAGCATDQEAAFYAIGNASDHGSVQPPKVHGITGLGATFVLGHKGSLRIDNSTPGTGVSVVFNERYVPDDDTYSTSTQFVSIMSVNGEVFGGSLADLSRPGWLFVPSSKMADAAAGSAIDQGYVPSLQLAASLDPAASLPIVAVDIGPGQPVTVVIPGYVSVPQGMISIHTADGQSAAGSISLSGGALAAMIDVSSVRPATFALDVQHPVKQKTLRIVSTSIGGAPKVTSTAIVQVNENGAYAVNFWSVQ